MATHFRASLKPSQPLLQGPPQSNLYKGALGTQAHDLSQTTTKKEASTRDCGFRLLRAGSQEDEYRAHDEALTDAAEDDVKGFSS
jgi:hypothetical protein